MRHAARSLGALLCTAGWLLAFAHPACAAQPALRHLRFKVSGTLATELRIVRHGFNETSAQSTSLSELHDSVDGTIDVAVTQAFPDYSIAVEVSEDSKGRSTAPIPVGILADGYLVVNAANAKGLLEEEAMVLSLLARKVIVGHDLVTGSAWTLSHKEGAIDSQTQMRIDGVQGDDRIEVSMNASFVNGTSNGVTQTSTGSIQYDPQFTVPTRVTIDAQKRTDSADQSTKTIMHFAYDLIQDSLKP